MCNNENEQARAVIGSKLQLKVITSFLTNGEVAQYRRWLMTFFVNQNSRFIEEILNNELMRYKENCPKTLQISFNSL